MNLIVKDYCETNDFLFSKVNLFRLKKKKKKSDENCNS